MAKSKHKRTAKTVLKLPDLETIEICGCEQPDVGEFPPFVVSMRTVNQVKNTSKAARTLSKL